jgi:plasmid stabilization system protein ParE
VSANVIVARTALADIERLSDFLAAVNPNAAERATETLETALRSLAQFPSRGPVDVDGVRRSTVPFGGSGYVIQYRFDKREVVVARIHHMREDR